MTVYPEIQSNPNDSVTLVLSRHETIPKKDFYSEVRATLDTELLKKAVILLDIEESNVDDIFERIIHALATSEPTILKEHIMEALFTQCSNNDFKVLSSTIHSFDASETVFDYDPTWVCGMCTLDTAQTHHVAIVRLAHPTNLGRAMEDVRFIVVVIAPSKEKQTKTAVETTRTFATLFSDILTRHDLILAQDEEEFRMTLLSAASELAMNPQQPRPRRKKLTVRNLRRQMFGHEPWYPFRGLKNEITKRWKCYLSDFTDGFKDRRSVQKVLSTTAFLYFACLLPSIAFGALNDDNTNGGINVRKVLIAQGIGGISFALFAGQPMVILLTTAPLSIYIKVIFEISHQLGLDFFSMYACVGVICQLFLILSSILELSGIMKLVTRSSEEIFSLFITIAFSVAGFRSLYTVFSKNYNCNNGNISEIISTISSDNGSVAELCRRDTTILHLMLMLGTLWFAMFLYNFRKTPYLTKSKRELLADYALPASVLLMSFVGSYLFSEITMDRFKMRYEIPLVSVADLFSLSGSGYVICLVLGFSLSLLFFMDQNISSALVDNSQKLKKGQAQNLDLLVVAILNLVLSILGLPWMHGALPHSPLHVRALADVEEHVTQGHVQEVITKVRETRVAALFSHILILLSALFLLPNPLQLIPTSVLYGLFLYMAVSALAGNEMLERLLLLFTEQSAYPPTHYIRKVPQRKVHLFTFCQLVQLLILCVAGFLPYPFVEMIFPIVFSLFVPIRLTLIPRLIPAKYLDVLDNLH